MAWLVAGLLIFLGTHSVRIFADGWRTTQIAARGEGRFKLVYTVASFVGLALIVVGYGLARQAPVTLYTPAIGLRHVALPLTLVSFWFLAAAYGPANHLRAAVGHPMVIGTKIWAFAHLLANGTLADVLLFGGFLVWAIVLFTRSRRRDRAAGKRPAPGTMPGTAIAVGVGTVAWLLFAFYLHGWLFGVQPLG
jgi:uncharacterized membrane protein